MNGYYIVAVHNSGGGVEYSDRIAADELDEAGTQVWLIEYRAECERRNSEWTVIIAEVYHDGTANFYHDPEDV